MQSERSMSVRAVWLTAWVFAAGASAVQGAITGMAAGGAQFIQGTGVSSSQPNFNLKEDNENEFGGHGYGETTLNFLAGTISGRNHGCVGPRSPLFQDNAQGTSNVLLGNETFTVRSTTLPANSSVSFTLRVSITSEVTGFVEDGVTASFSTNSFLVRIRNSAFFQGRHEATDDWNKISGTQDFAGATAEKVTLTKLGASSARVNESFAFTLSADSTTQATHAFLGGFPLASGSAGFGITFGLESITDGATLEWRGVPWTGSTGNSSDLLPPNPINAVPEPAGCVVLLAAAFGVCRRNRRHA